MRRSYGLQSPAPLAWFDSWGAIMTIVELELWGCVSRPWFVPQLTMGLSRLDLVIQSPLRFNAPR